jgi:hypothetical protein
MPLVVAARLNLADCEDGNTQSCPHEGVGVILSRIQYLATLLIEFAGTIH